MSGALEAICEDAEDFKDAICKQMETFSQFVLHFWVFLKTTEKTAISFGEERILPFTYDYVIPKSDCFGDMLSRASQCEMSYQASLLEIILKFSLSKVSQQSMERNMQFEQAICHSTTGRVVHPLKIIIFTIYERQSLDNCLSLFWNNLNGRRCMYSLNR